MKEIEWIIDEFTLDKQYLYNKDRINLAKAIEEYVKDRESVTYAYGLLSNEAHQQDIIKARIEELERLKPTHNKGDFGNIALLERIEKRIAELKKGLK